jgi:DNA-binding transcriptional LysR family regulator
MNLDNLVIFLDVVHRGSFASVSKARGLDPSAISRAIGTLEKELGIRLFQRSTRRNVLTDSGRIYFEKIRHLVEELRIANATLKERNAQPQGRLRLTASIAFGQTCILPHLRQFRAAYPNIALDLLFSDANVDLIGENIDIAIRLGPRLDVSYIGTQLRPVRYHVCASPDYVKQHPEITKPNDLSGLSCLLLDLPAYRDRWLFRKKSGPVKSVPVSGDLLFSNMLAIRDCALSGLGPALMADWLMERDLKKGTLIALFPDYRVTATDEETAAWLLYPNRSYLPAKTRVFIDFIKTKLSKTCA